MKRVTVAAALGSALILVGCAKVEGMMEQGDLPAIVAMAATNDVLLAEGVEIHRSPICGRNEDPVCEGETRGGEPIRAKVTGLDLRVEVGGRTLYDGPMQEVLDRQLQRGGAR